MTDKKLAWTGKRIQLDRRGHVLHPPRDELSENRLKTRQNHDLESLMCCEALEN